MINRIELIGLKFFAHHGLYEEERQKGGWFVVDICFECIAAGGIAKDEIEGTVNYEDVYRIVKGEMEVASKLIEHVAGRIHQRIKMEVEGVSQLSTTVKKMGAPLGGPLEHVSITISEE